MTIFDFFRTANWEEISQTLTLEPIFYSLTPDSISFGYERTEPKGFFDKAFRWWEEFTIFNISTRKKILDCELV